MPRARIFFQLRRYLGRVAADETGAGTLFSLFFLAICLIIGGAMIDVTNAWRHREVLRLSADVASHAGVVALAQGADAKDSWDAAVKATEFNTPTKVYGRIMRDPQSDVRVMHYDPATNRLSQDGRLNAVRVRVERSAETGNPVPALLLRVAAGGGWNIVQESVAALVPTRRCIPSQGLFAHEGVTLDGPTSFAGGVCAHGQAGVDIGDTVDFAPGSVLSMPDLANCGGACRDDVNPGVVRAAVESNLVMTPPGQMIDSLAAAFADPDRLAEEETLFFRDRPLDDDLSALGELGLVTEDMETGSVVELSAIDFSKIRDLPEGLVYVVACRKPSADDEAIGVAQEVILSGGGMAPALRRSALVTNCPVVFGPDAELEGALVIATAEVGAGMAPSVTADPAARIADVAGACTPASQSVLYARGDVILPATFPAAGLAVAAEGNLALVPTDGRPVTHRGVSLHAGGGIALTGNHSFAGCPAQSAARWEGTSGMPADRIPPIENAAGPSAGGYAPDEVWPGLLPGLYVIRHVLPEPENAPTLAPPPRRPKTIVVASN